MKIGVDIDGVLADFTSAFNALVKAEYGITLPNPAPSWNWHRDGGVTKEMDSKLWGYIMDSMWWGTLFPMTGAVEALERLNLMSRAGDDIYFITSRPGKLSKFLTEMWLKFHGMDAPTVLVTSNKGPVVKGLGLDVFVDDKPENNYEVIQATGYGEVRVYLIDAPYNQWADQPKNYGTRIASLSAVLDLEAVAERKAA
jgi:uncharacterized HAD superfamily protein